MKILFHTAYFLLIVALPCQAATVPEVVVPDAKLSMEQALEKAKSYLRAHRHFRIVSVDWAKVAGFQPRISNGGTYNSVGSPDEWAWFFTCLYSDEDGRPLHEHALLIEVQNDGLVADLPETRT